jgi:hypothetical protein
MKLTFTPDRLAHFLGRVDESAAKAAAECEDYEVIVNFAGEFWSNRAEDTHEADMAHGHVGMLDGYLQLVRFGPRGVSIAWYLDPEALQGVFDICSTHKIALDVPDDLYDAIRTQMRDGIKANLDDMPADFDLTFDGAHWTARWDSMFSKFYVDPHNDRARQLSLLATTAMYRSLKSISKELNGPDDNEDGIWEFPMRYNQPCKKDAFVHDPMTEHYGASDMVSLVSCDCPRCKEDTER